MCLVKCKGKWKDSGQHNLYFSSTLIKTQVLPVFCWDTEVAEKLNFVPCFQNQPCSKLNTSLTLEPSAQKLYNYILSLIFTFLLGKRVHYQCYQKPPTADPPFPPCQKKSEIGWPPPTAPNPRPSSPTASQEWDPSKTVPHQNLVFKQVPHVPVLHPEHLILPPLHHGAALTTKMRSGTLPGSGPKPPGSGPKLHRWPPWQLQDSLQHPVDDRQRRTKPPISELLLSYRPWTVIKQPMDCGGVEGSADAFLIGNAKKTTSSRTRELTQDGSHHQNVSPISQSHHSD